MYFGLLNTVSQAIHALAEKPTAIVSSTLTKSVLVTNYYYRIRSEAALALVQVRSLSWAMMGMTKRLSSAPSGSSIF